MEMGDRAALTVIFLEFYDMEIWREYSLWEIAEVPELVGLEVSALH